SSRARRSFSTWSCSKSSNRPRRPVVLPSRLGLPYIHVGRSFIPTFFLVGLKSDLQARGSFSGCPPSTVPPAALLLRLAEARRSEEHTSELQSRENLVCR